MAEDTPAIGAYEDLEPPEILAHNLQIGARLAAAAEAFALLAFVFAYLYLRALNSNGNWRPKHVDPSGGIGVAIVACLVIAAAAYWFGVHRLGDGTEPGWRAGAGVALVLWLGAFGLIVAQLAAISFGPTSGGYASVFIGWHAVYGLFLLVLVYWLETLVAQSLRTHTRQVAPEASDVATPYALMRPAADALGVALYVSALLGVLGYVLLYVA